MTDVFISYAREDRAFAGRLAEALGARGVKVWWDWDLIGGDNYRARIREVIGQSRKSIVLWSRQSANSAFVIDEASEAKKLGKLIPVSIDGSDPPFGFGDLHTIQLDDNLDIEILVASLQGRPPPLEHELRKPPPRRLAIAALAGAVALCLVALAGGAYWMLGRQASPVGPAPAPAAQAAVAPTPEAVPRAMTARVALVIGNSDYRQLPRLENAVRDADRVAAALEQRGFRVIKEVNLTAETMTAALKDFENTLSIVGGVGVFYYAGSAVYVDGEDIMLPIDATADMQKGRIDNGVNFTRLQREIKSRTTSKVADRGYALVYSASKGEFAADGPTGGNSPFTSAFLGALGRADDELGDIYRRIRAQLSAQQQADPAATKQTPYIENNLLDPFYFGRPERDAQGGIAKILIFDSCRDNPFKMDIVTR